MGGKLCRRAEGGAQPSSVFLFISTHFHFQGPPHTHTQLSAALGWSVTQAAPQRRLDDRERQLVEGTVYEGGAEGELHLQPLMEGSVWLRHGADKQLARKPSTLVVSKKHRRKFTESITLTPAVIFLKSM